MKQKNKIFSNTNSTPCSEPNGNKNSLSSKIILKTQSDNEILKIQKLNPSQDISNKQEQGIKCNGINNMGHNELNIISLGDIDNLKNKMDDISPIPEPKFIERKMSGVCLVDYEGALGESDGDKNEFGLSSEEEDELSGGVKKKYGIKIGISSMKRLDSENLKDKDRKGLLSKEKGNKKSKDRKHVQFNVTENDKDKKLKGYLNKSFNCNFIERENYFEYGFYSERNNSSGHFNNNFNRSQIMNYYEDTSKYLFNKLLQENAEYSNRSLNKSNNYPPKQIEINSDLFKRKFFQNNENSLNNNSESLNSNLNLNTNSFFNNFNLMNVQQSFGGIGNNSTKNGFDFYGKDSFDVESGGYIVKMNDLESNKEDTNNNLSNKINNINDINYDNKDDKNSSIFSFKNGELSYKDSKLNSDLATSNNSAQHSTNTGLNTNINNNGIQKTPITLDKVHQLKFKGFNNKNLIINNNNINNIIYNINISNGNNNHDSDANVKPINTQESQKEGEDNNKINIEASEDSKDEFTIKMFGRNGWICNQCNNFNYESRNKCNRCGVDKDPKKISDIKIEKELNEQKKKLKKKKDKKGDWYCTSCGNLNYGFRKICNRCQAPRQDILENMFTNNKFNQFSQYEQPNDLMVPNYNNMNPMNNLYQTNNYNNQNYYFPYQFRNQENYNYICDFNRTNNN